jgi:DNA replication protein DnaC
MSTIDTMMPLLKALKMSGIAGTLDVRCRQAVEQQLSHLEFLNLVIQDEYERRESKKLNQRLRRACFTGQKTLDNFRFDVSGLKLNKSLIFDLVTCKFINEKCNVLIVGPTGVGKSHLAQAIGHSACLKGYDVLYLSATKLFKQLRAARADNTLDKKIKSFARYDLLVIDDLGLKSLQSPADEDFHEIVCERHEKCSTIITSNLDFEEWGGIFPNQILASATVDRLRDNAYRFVIEGESFRKPRPLV